MKVRFLTLAQQEVDDAAFWYGNQAEDTADEFLDDLDRAVRLVKSYPLASRKLNLRFEDVCWHGFLTL
jgi:plasmid stabilization system protein ParE